ncbi:ABC transporter permease [Roseiterribacter gracilis]|uniref:Membrane protein n=1 Tax=Roseiterribacter gracilis TaxID=2812848 RepID=A0A8S8XCX4_9PROT|nr:membrane protein [Rhodospirillales bacterium TMPK1]
MSLASQVSAVVRMNVKSIGQRFWPSLSTVVAVMLVVLVLLSFLAMANGFQQTIRGAGRDDVAIVLRAGATTELNSGLSRDQVRLLGEGPGVAHDANGDALLSPELFVIADGKKKATGLKANLPLRGIGAAGAGLRDNLKIAEGRMFASGSNELVVGRGVQREFENFDLGSKVTLGKSQWVVVGIFETGGSVFESELWADLPVVQSLFNRTAAVQTVRAKLDGPDGLQKFKDYATNDPRLKLDVLSETQYFSDQASQTSGLIQYLGWPLAIAMAFGALAGALNTMYSAVLSRTREIATLRAIGYGGFPAFVGTLVESLVLAAVGGCIGALAAWIFFDGLSATTLGASFTQVVFKFEMSPKLVEQGLVLGMAIGLIGGLLPAFRAARVPIIAGLAER